jgi:hypothetical protein
MPSASRLGPVGATISIVVYFTMAYEVELLPPAVEFLRGIDTKVRAKAARAIELLRQFGRRYPCRTRRSCLGIRSGSSG